jgi:ATP-dependent exoDNAse (exonuclease V) beta subunit
MSLVVYKSSAGSGKTTTLVNEYLSLALRKPERFGNIIALTFTIKATTEMKERVFVVLDKIINLDKYRDDLGLKAGIDHIKNATNLSEAEIRNRSKILLHNILHHYTDFSFSTIDSFVMNIVRSFAHDLNLPFDFNVELDSSFLVEQAIAMLFEKIGENKELTDFLIQYILQNVDKESSLKIENELANLGKILFESRHYKSVELLNTLELNQFSEINTKLHKDISIFENHLAKIAKEGLALFESNGIEASDFSRGTLPKQLENIIEGKIDVNHKVFVDPENNSFYPKSKSDAIKSRIDSIRPRIVSLINSIADYFELHAQDYYNKKLILEKLNPLALLSEIKRMLDQYSAENNVIHLSESNKMIANIVLDEHIPFIYERVGRKYLHFLIDEFQDTSVIQWNNLIPLIDNSLATDNFNMLVGDAKQSIYRWRDGDVDQFINLPKIANAKSSPIMQERAQSIERNYEEKILDHNYRSELNIIEFNNAFFDFQLNHTFGNKDKAYSNKDSERISKIYEQHHQIAGKKEDNGRVVIQNFPKDGEQSYEEGLIAHINELLEQNYRLQDIAIIARSKKVLAKNSDILVRNGFNVVSNETLFIEKNPEVSLITSFLNFVGNKDRKNNLLNINYLLSRRSKSSTALDITSFLDKIGKSDDIKTLCASISKFGYNISPKKVQELQSYDLAEYLINTLNLTSSPNPFVQSLLNSILENSQSNGAGISAFIDFWEMKKDVLSISLPENIDAVKLYTIHKAKGLEFPVVIFAANGFTSSSKGVFHWVNPQEAGIDNIEVAMVNHKDDMQYSSFKEQYLDEKDKQKMDDLNLIYVANTRPTEQLIILFEEAKGSAWDKFKDFTIDNDKFVQDEENLKVYGTIKKQKAASKKVTENTITQTISNHLNTQIRLRSNAALGLSDEQNNKIEKGKIIHYLLSQVKTEKEIESTIQNAILKGIVQANEQIYYTQKLNEIIKHPQIKPFFDENNTEINEGSIILPDGKQLRPDKVIVSKNKTIIIDYKVSDYDKISANDKQKNAKQVNNYRNLIENMNYPNVKTYLIYIEGITKCIEIDPR